MKTETGPIFSLGIMPRCGTNFLSNQLLLHPDCAPPEPLWEGYLPAHADRLTEWGARAGSERPAYRRLFGP